MAGLSLKSVKKRFGETEVIRGVDLDVRDGEFVVFVGPSGCGKSTLLRMIAGLEEITGGELFIGGGGVTGEDPAKRGIAMVFQNYALYPHMTVATNMGFPLEMAKRPKDEIDRKVRDAAKILHLEQYLERKPRELSGGQRQRVAIGRAIVRQPGVFLFDEPLSNLDAELRVQMRIEIAKLHQDLGTTMIYVTHDQVEAMTLADKIVVLEAGNVRQVGAPLELYHRPQNLFVAGFIGSPKMNFLKVKASAVDAEGITVSGDGVPTLKVAVDSTGAAAGEDVTLGIRPEHIKLGTENGLPVEVTFVERLGHQTIVQAHRGDDETPLIAVLDGDVPVKAGERRAFVFSGDDCHLFNAAGNAYARRFVPE